MRQPEALVVGQIHVSHLGWPWRLPKATKAREELLKVAQKSTIYDDEGVEVPKVSVSYNKDSLVVKFTK